MDKNSGIVLEGGASRGVFTSGVLDYLMEQEIYFPYVVGVSAGACNALDYVSRQKGRTLECMLPNPKAGSNINISNILKTRHLYDMDLIFDRYPNEIIPFDYETYFDSDIECEMVVTNCISGKAEYLSESSSKTRLMNVCRASSSVPIATPMVTVDSIPYLDGGIADSIPLLHSMKKGHKKNVVVLTRNLGYRKTPPRQSKPTYMALFRKYPKLVRTMLKRYQMYNHTIRCIEKWEAQGHIFVIRPEIQPVARTEKNYDALMTFYEHGYEIMQEKLQDMLAFLS
ncbi:MAG: patatin family protein [Lachnospiraceae bacterium]